MGRQRKWFRFKIKPDGKTLYSNPYSWNQGHYVPQLSQVIVRHNRATAKETINLKGYMVGNDDYHDHLGLFQFMWSAGLVSDDTYKLLNVLCDSQSFIHTSSSCDKILDIASEELGSIDPYSIYTPPCTANISQSNQLLKRTRVVGRTSENSSTIEIRYLQ
ncbi:hypothetical protein ACOSP7_004559 [Xanthoceras sorbifolium]